MPKPNQPLIEAAREAQALNEPIEVRRLWHVANSAWAEIRAPKDVLPRVYVLTAESPVADGFKMQVFERESAAHLRAAELANQMRADTSHSYPQATASTWQATVDAIADTYGAAHCYINIEHVPVEE